MQTDLAQASSVEALRPPSFWRTLALAVVNFVIWLEINIRRGAYTALIASGWLVGSGDSTIWAIALAGSAAQWYVTGEWNNKASLFARSDLFRRGSAVILFVWDIAFPAWGLLVSAQKDNPWSWINYGIAVIIQLCGSWYCQQNWTNATGDLLKIMRDWRTPNESTLVLEGGQD
jgi:hypothetical protein